MKPLKPRIAMRFRPSLAETRRKVQASLDHLLSMSPRDDAKRIDVGARPKRVVTPRTGERRVDARKILERDVLRAVHQYLGSHPKVAWVARLNSGGVYNQSGQFVRFNSMQGGSDLIGQMRSGHFLAIECKRPGQEPTIAQNTFLRIVQTNGGCSGWCDSIAGVQEILDQWGG